VRTGRERGGEKGKLIEIGHGHSRCVNG